MPNYRITLEYDGTNYVGWQRQENGLSIQQLVEEAIEKLTKQKIILFGAGRTDAGVHARGQVANFELQQHFDSDTIRDGINHYLRPQPISILNAEEIDKDFKKSKGRLLNCKSMFEVAEFVGQQLHNKVKKHSENEINAESTFQANLILGGQIKGSKPSLFLIYPEGNFIEGFDPLI